MQRTAATLSLEPSLRPADRPRAARRPTEGPAAPSLCSKES